MHNLYFPLPSSFCNFASLSWSHLWQTALVALTGALYHAPQWLLPTIGIGDLKVFTQRWSINHSTEISSNKLRNKTNNAEEVPIHVFWECMYYIVHCRQKCLLKMFDWSNATYAANQRVCCMWESINLPRRSCLPVFELVPRLCDASVLLLFFTFFMTSPQNNWTFVTSSSQDNLLCDVILLSSRITCFNWRTFFNNLNYTFWRRQLYQCIHRVQNAETLSLFIFL